MDGKYFRFCGDGVAYEDRRREFPVLAQKHGTRPWHIHRHQRVQQSRRQAALDDQPAEFRLRGERGIEVQGIAVAGDFEEGVNVFKAAPALGKSRNG
jgi:hypothetical protein